MIPPDISPPTIASAIEENAIDGVKAWVRWPEVAFLRGAALTLTLLNRLRLRAGAPTGG